MGDVLTVNGSTIRQHRQNLAKQLALANYELLNELVDIRIESGLTQQDVANLLKVSQQSISKFESLESDPRLSTITKYAMAINVLVGHTITELPRPKDLGSGSKKSSPLSPAV